MKDWKIPRRTFLKGLGTAIALPMLDAMVPVKALAGTAGKTHPTRMAFLFVPNGVHMQDWTPKQVGSNFELPYILQPLESLKKDLVIMSGLTQDKGRANGDGPGDHARSATVFLTGAQPLKSEGASIRAGISADQYAALHVGNQTRFASLELGAEAGRQSGNCDSGYSCAYSNNISWRNETTPMAKEVNPRRAFERLFANELQHEVTESQARRNAYRKSILDFVLDDAKRLQGHVGGNDRQKLDEYLTAIRELELRLEHSEKQDKSIAISSDQRPTGTPQGYEDHLRLMADMLVLAFQTDVTRVATYMLANEGSNRNYRFIGVNNGHHELSHHQGDPVKHNGIKQINRFHVTQLAYFLNRLKSIPEGDGTLLDHSMIVYGSAISDGNRHNNEDLPLLLAGNGGGTITTGRHVKYPQETPMCNLLLSLLDRMGAPAQRFGDSTGRLKYLV